MPIHAGIVVVEGMGSDAVDEGSVGCRQIAAGGDFRGALVLRGGGDSAATSRTTSSPAPAIMTPTQSTMPMRAS